MSIGHRVTGAGLATLIYGFGIYYAVAQPGIIIPAMAATVSELPTALTATAKFILAVPFFFHTYNGIRHLVWDTGRALTLRATYIGGWLVNIGSVVSGAIVSILL